MDFINRAVAQLNDLFKSMTPGARITAGMLLVLIVVSLAYLFRQQSSGPDAYLMGGEPFSASQLNAMEAAFAKGNLSNYEIDGNRIRVPRGQHSSYMGALADAGALPADFGKYLEKAVSSTNVFMTKEQRNEALKAAKQSELQLVISNMKGVERASVIYDVQEKRGLDAERVVTASVSVKPLGSQALDENQAPQIRHLVASAIAGLKPENITINDLNGRVYPGGSGASGGAGSSLMGMDDSYGSRKRFYEKEWQSKIAAALSFIPNVVVNANVELDLETGHEESAVDYDPKAVAYRVVEKTGSKTTEGASGGGRPGLASQQPGANSAASLSGANSGPKSAEEDAQAEQQNLVSSKSKKITQHGLTPKRVTASVSIPSNYYEKIWQERNPPQAGQAAQKPDANALNEIENKVKIDVEHAVVALLPSPGASVDPFPRIVVSSFPSLTPQPIAGPQIQDQALAWLGNYWSSLGIGALALVSLTMLRSMVKAVPSAPTASESASLAPPSLNLVTEDEQPAPAEPQNARSRLKRRGAGGPSLRDELAGIVKEDPDAAVSILRTWIGNAS